MADNVPLIPLLDEPALAGEMVYEAGMIERC
jgi:hypothetical protein